MEFWGSHPAIRGKRKKMKTEKQTAGAILFMTTSVVIPRYKAEWKELI